MPLSDHEQRLLDQIERALYAEDPKFAHAVRTTNPQVHYKRRLIKAGLGFLLGVCVLMGGLIVHNAGPVTIIISVAGFLLMMACSVWGLQSWKRMTGIGTEADLRSPRPARARAKGTGGTGGGFMNRLEERWRRRTEGE